MSYSKFDLTFKIGQYLDRHLVFPLLEFLAAKETYDQSELLQVKLEILSKTNMIDYVIDIRRMLYPDEETPEEIKSRRGVVLSQLQELQDAVEPVLRLMQRDDVMKTVETMRDPKTLINYLTTNKEFEFKIQMIDSMYQLAKYRYECGNYVESASYLYFCQLVMNPTDKVLVAIKFMAGGSYQREVGQDHNLCVAQRTASKYLGQVVAAINRSLKPIWIAFPGTERERRDVAAAFQHKYGLPDLLGTLDCTHVGIFPPRRPHGLQFINRKGKHTINVQLNYLSVLWGKLASEILVQNWDGALDDLTKLREFIDNGAAGAAATNMQALQQRTWLVHWSLFVFFNHVKGRDLIIEMFLYKPLYLNAIQTMCPHILRYLATAVIINRSRRNALKDLVKVIQQEAYTYRDPITEFIEHLYVNFDFEAARRKLNQCQAVLLTDFFLIACLDEFVENARLMIFETFCRIHQVISIGMLAENLNMQPDEAECWIVNLIRNARLDAKIDSKLGHVVMGAQPLSPYQQLVERIDSLAVRSEALTSVVERKHKARNQDIRWGAQEF